MSNDISFNVDKEDFDIISSIALRAREMFAEAGYPQPLMQIQMDLVACHANGCPLKLQELLDAEHATFAHDIGGIARHLNRDTGGLEDCFLPRTAATVN